MNNKKVKEKNTDNIYILQAEKHQAKNKRGITLIALVITIVVLLILAGISINLIFNDGGIIKKASDAIDRQKEAEESEKSAIESLGEQANALLNGETEEVQAPEGSLLAMYRQAVADKCDNADGNCTNLNHLHIGDFVNYVEPTNGSYTVTPERSGMEASSHLPEDRNQTYTLSTTKNNVNWRVLGIDKKTGGIKLIAADPIQKNLLEEYSEDTPFLSLYNAEAYEYGPSELDNICKMYLNETYASEARSVNMDDLDEAIGINSIDQKRSVDFNQLAYSSALPVATKFTLENQYTPKRWLDKKSIENEGTGNTLTGTTIDGEVTGYMYFVVRTQDDAEMIQSSFGGYTPIVLSNERIFDTLFGNPSSSEDSGFFLASNGVISNGTNASYSILLATNGSRCWCHRFFTGQRSLVPGMLPGGSSNVNAAVRPLIVLKPNVLNSSVPKIADQPSTWTSTD